MSTLTRITNGRLNGGSGPSGVVGGFIQGDVLPSVEGALGATIHASLEVPTISAEVPASFTGELGAVIVGEIGVQPITGELSNG